MHEDMGQSADGRFIQPQKFAQFKVPHRLVIRNEGQQDANGLLHGTVFKRFVFGRFCPIEHRITSVMYFPSPIRRRPDLSSVPHNLTGDQLPVMGRWDFRMRTGPPLTT